MDQSIKSQQMGVLLVNLGTPAAPTAGAVRAFLREFLSDRVVVGVPKPKWLWRFVLEKIIPTWRAPHVAKKYQKIWTPEGSPLAAISRRIAVALQAALSEQMGEPVVVVAGMRYGEPSLDAAIGELKERSCKNFFILPLFPQPPGKIIDSILYAIGDAEWRLWGGKLLSEIETKSKLMAWESYFKEPLYIEALAGSVREQWAATGRPERLLISFHGMPVPAWGAAGYAKWCAETAALLAARLELKEHEWKLCYQSRFGSEAWLGPYTFDLLKKLGQTHAKHVDVIAPGFAADCLETLYELAIEGRELFQSNGGGEYDYIGALNDRPEHVGMMAGIVLKAVKEHKLNEK